MSIDNYSNEEVMIASLLINDSIRGEVKSYVKDWMFSLDYIRVFVVTLLDNSFDSKKIEKDLFMILYKKNSKQEYDKLSNDQKNKVLTLLDNNINREWNEESKRFIFNQLEQFITNKYIWKGISAYSEGNTKAGVEYFTFGTSFKLQTEEPISFTKETIKLMRERNNPTGSSFESSIKLVNLSSSYGGYIYGDLVAVVAPPKTGKSTFMAQEGTHLIRNNRKVLHLCFGDMDEYNVFVKYCANISGEPLQKIIPEAESYYEKYEEIFKNNLQVKSFPAHSIDIYNVVSYCKKIKKKFNYDAVVIDYDANISVPNSNMNMYEAGGLVYIALKGLAQSEKCIVFVGSQPKQQYYDVEVLGMECPSESSRKVHAVDWMITIGRNQVCPHVGTLNLACVRNGESGNKTRVRFEYRSGRVVEISPSQYDSEIKEFENNKGKEAGEISISGLKVQNGKPKSKF